MSKATPNNEEELLKLVSEADEFAFEKLFNFYRNRIYGIALKLTHSTTIAEEIVQDVFLKIWLNRVNLTDIQNFGAYLFIATRNEAFSVLKRIARDYNMGLSQQADIAAESNAEDFLMEKEYSFLLKKAVDALPAQQKQVYKLIKDEGLKREEAAHLLQLQPETVKFHLARAMKHIRAFCLPHLNLFIGFIICFPFVT